jgi:hypothetical protein
MGTLLDAHVYIDQAWKNSHDAVRYVGDLSYAAVPCSELARPPALAATSM